MKDKRDYRDYLHDILRYAEMAERITLGIDFETFAAMMRRPSQPFRSWKS